MTPGILLIFDMDGVLVDVTDSYRQAVIQTVRHFAGFPITNALIQDFKNQGGWNDDWALTFHIIHESGVDVGYDEVVRQFQKFFRGDSGYDGLIQNERWIAKPGLFDRLARAHRLAVFTGRLHEEAEVTLNRYAPGVFRPVIGTDDVTEPKPSPAGINRIRAGLPLKRVIYVGDTVDDARCAQAAKVSFIGVAGQHSPRRAETVQALEQLGAMGVIESINDIETML